MGLEGKITNLWDVLTKMSSRRKLRQLLKNVVFPKTGSPLIMGTAINYAEPALAPFVTSLRRSGYAGKVVFFIQNLSDDTKRFLHFNGVETVDIPPKYNLYHIQNSRWFHYLDYLEGLIASHDNLPSHVLFTDVRDVYFQDDPFRDEVGYLEFFLEHETPKLGECKYNSSWIKLCYGDLVLEQMSHNIISCSGTTIGSTAGAIEYLLEMEKLLNSIPRQAKKKALDQGPHNYLVRSHRLHGALVAENAGRVFTIGYTPDSDIYISDEGVILSSSGYRSPIVHQFDRHTKVLRAIR